MIEKDEMKKMIQSAVGTYFNSPGKMYHEIERLRADNANLRKALKPFADAKHLDDVTFGHLSDAAAAIKEREDR